MNDSVMVGILTRGIVSTDWAIGLRKLELPEKNEIFKLPGLPYDHARNVVVEEMLRKGYETLLFLDDDVIPPPDTFRKLSSARREIVSGLYYKRQGRIQPAMFREAHPLPYPVEAYRPGEFIEVDLVGAGCLLIHRRVFEDIPYPWFEWKMDRKDLPPHERLGEDMAFCRNARKAGFGVYVDTSVKCLHVGWGRSDTEGKFLPME